MRRVRLTILARLVIGYSVIFIFVVALSTYVIRQLYQTKDIAHHILTVNVRIVDYEKKLAATFLSQIGHGMKFLVVKDEKLYNQFLLNQNDFDQYLKELMLMAAPPQVMSLINSVKLAQQRYQLLFREEAAYLFNGEEYSQGQYEEEKETAIDQTIEGLKQIRLLCQQDTYNKLKKMGEAVDNAQKVALGITAITLVFGVIISIVVTRSITKPLSLVKRKTKNVAKGDFEGNLYLSSPPEIGELAQAFNFMCAKLKEVDRMKSDFFSSMSHELRTPLTSIKEGTSLLLEGIGGKLEEKQSRLLGIIAEESNRLIHLVSNLLDLSKMEAGMISFNLAPSDLSVLIDKAIMEVEPLAEVKNIKLEQPGAKVPIFVAMDSERILQVLRNLIGNALKFAPHGGEVKVSAQPVDGGVQVAVADTGEGISPKELEKIFDKFHQATDSGFNHIKGTGLGLSIVKHIIDAHGGKVWAESEPGKGSTFIFVLPS